MVMSNKEKQEVALKLCDLVNERFGLEVVLLKVVDFLNVSSSTKKRILHLAKNRRIGEVDEILSNCGTVEINKPHYVFIEDKKRY